MTDSKLVILTRDHEGNAAWSKLLESHGIRSYGLPCIETAPLALSPALTEALTHLSDYQWLIFTSATGVHYFAATIAQLGLDMSSLGQIKIAVVGTQTSGAIKSLGLRASFIPPVPTADSLAALLPDPNKQRILMLGADISSSLPAKALRSRGADVTHLPVYQTRPIKLPDPEFRQLVRESLVSTLIFASPSAVEGFGYRASHVIGQALNLPAIAIGPKTRTALEKAHFRAISTASEPSVAAILRLI